jgi:hypothetical protein
MDGVCNVPKPDCGGMVGFYFYGVRHPETILAPCGFSFKIGGHPARNAGTPPM